MKSFEAWHAVSQTCSTFSDLLACCVGMALLLAVSVSLIGKTSQFDGLIPLSWTPTDFTGLMLGLSVSLACAVTQEAPASGSSPSEPSPSSSSPSEPSPSEPSPSSSSSSETPKKEMSPDEILSAFKGMKTYEELKTLIDLRDPQIERIFQLLVQADRESPISGYGRAFTLCLGLLTEYLPRSQGQVVAGLFGLIVPEDITKTEFLGKSGTTKDRAARGLEDLKRFGFQAFTAKAESNAGRPELEDQFADYILELILGLVSDEAIKKLIPLIQSDLRLSEEVREQVLTRISQHLGGDDSCAHNYQDQTDPEDKEALEKEEEEGYARDLQEIEAVCEILQRSIDQLKLRITGEDAADTLQITNEIENLEQVKERFEQTLRNLSSSGSVEVSADTSASVDGTDSKQACVASSVGNTGSCAFGSALELNNWMSDTMIIHCSAKIAELYRKSCQKILERFNSNLSLGDVKELLHSIFHSRGFTCALEKQQECYEFFSELKKATELVSKVTGEADSEAGSEGDEELAKVVEATQATMEQMRIMLRNGHKCGRSRGRCQGQLHKISLTLSKVQTIGEIYDQLVQDASKLEDPSVRAAFVNYSMQLRRIFKQSMKYGETWGSTAYNCAAKASDKFLVRSDSKILQMCMSSYYMAVQNYQLEHGSTDDVDATALSDGSDAPAGESTSEANTTSSSEDCDVDAATAESECLALHFCAAKVEKLTESIIALLQTIEAGKTPSKAGKSKEERKTSLPDFQSAEDFLRSLQEKVETNWRRIRQEVQKNHDAYLLQVMDNALSMIQKYLDTWLGYFENSSAYGGATRAARSVNSSRTATGISKIWYVFDCDLSSLIDEDPQDTVAYAKAVVSDLRKLREIISQKKEARNPKLPYRRDYPFQEAMGLLEQLADRIEAAITEAQTHVDAAYLFQALNGLARSISALADPWLDKVNSPTAPYTTSGTVSASVANTKTAGEIEEIFSKYDQLKFGNKPEWDSDSPFARSSYVYQEAEEGIMKWVQAATETLDPAKRAELVTQFIQQGKNPLMIETWLEYITSEESAQTYADPARTGTYCSCTAIGLHNAFVYLTGFEVGDRTLTTILTEKMDYHRRQISKQAPVGPSHPLRDLQYRYMNKMKEICDDEDTLVCSIDTKAFIVLGRMKHDGRRILCSPDGKVYSALDHDFVFRVRDIYPNGHHKIPRARMNEKAVLHPVGAYCPKTRRGFVSLVLGKDTAEAVCNMLRTMLRLEAQEGRTYKNLMLLADGGGANQANGVVWCRSLLSLTEEYKINATVCHSSPNSSKYNLIERALWSPVTKSCSGKPYLDIDHVMRYFSAATDKNGLSVTCWFDGIKYLTEAERQARGGTPYTREKLAKEAGNRILHHFEEKSDMFRWNYTVFCSEKEAEASRDHVLERTAEILQEIKAAQSGPDAKAAEIVKAAQAA